MSRSWRRKINRSTMLRRPIIEINSEVIGADIRIRAVASEVLDGPGVSRRGRGSEKWDEREEGSFELHFEVEGNLGVR